MNMVKPPCDQGYIQGTAITTPCTPGREPWILATTILGSSIAFIDGTVVNVALPVLQRDLQATVGDTQWIIEAYALFLSALILVGGSLGDRFGRRRIFAIGITIFTLASLWCGLSPNTAQLIIARAVQGIGGALLVPGSLAIIGASFNPNRRGRAIGTWSGFTSITSAVGPLLGGWLVQNASWRWVFFINIPLAIIVLVLLFWHVPESRDEEAAVNLDWSGALLVTAGLGGLVFGLIQAGQFGLEQPTVLVAIGIGILLLIAFVLVEAHIPHPMLPLSLFHSRNFSGANLLTLLLYGALGGSMFFIPFNLIQVQHYSPLAAGAAMLPFILIMFSLSRWSGGLVARYGARLPLIIGPIITAIGFFLYTLPGANTGAGNYWFTFFPAIVVMGLGMSICVAPLTTTVMDSVSSQQMGIASGVNNAVSRTAGLLAIAILGIVMTTTFNASLDNHLAGTTTTPETRRSINAQRDKLGAIEIPPGIGDELTIALKQGIADSFVSGFRVVMSVSAVLALASALCSALMLEKKDITPQPVSQKAASEIPAE